MTRGLLLLDVDGPLNPYAARPHRRPPGYRTFRHTANGRWYSGKAAREHRGLRVWLNPEHGPMLRAPAEETGLEPAWATTWMHLANELVGPVLGLPELPVVEFPERDLVPGQGWRADGGWKWPAFAGDRPPAWLDDELDGWTDARVEFEAGRTAPTLLCAVDPGRGLGAAHLAEVRGWVRDGTAAEHRDR